MEYAGFWRRFWAYVIDLIILGFLAAVLRALTGEDDIGIVDFLANPDEPAPNGLSVLVTWFYFAWLESSARRATPGKQALGLVVTDLGGNRISFLRATGRFFAKFLSALILLIGFIMAAFTERHQVLHDKIADTVVVRT